jgi:transposase
VSAGQRHECLYAEPVLSAVRIRRRNGRVRTRPKAVAGDKGYSYARVRRYLRRRKIKDVIPTRKDQRRRPGFDKDTYRRRNVVERCLGWLKESRAVATRFDKRAVNYLVTVKLAMLRRYLRILTTTDSSDRP